MTDVLESDIQALFSICLFKIMTYYRPTYKWKYILFSLFHIIYHIQFVIILWIAISNASSDR